MVIELAPPVAANASQHRQVQAVVALPVFVADWQQVVLAIWEPVVWVQQPLVRQALAPAVWVVQPPVPQAAFQGPLRLVRVPHQVLAAVLPAVVPWAVVLPAAVLWAAVLPVAAPWAAVAVAHTAAAAVRRAVVLVVVINLT